MKFLFGIIITLLCVLGSFIEMGGSISALMQPAEFFIILGSGIGSFIIGNSKHIIFRALKDLKLTLKKTSLNKKTYEELLLFLYNSFKTIKSQGILSVEQSLDAPYKSDFFASCPSLLKQTEALSFFCDYMRLISMSCDNHYDLEEIMHEDINAISEEKESTTEAINTLGDSLPALGIVAAVLGVINTMANINAPPEILGKSIGGALVGTFLGILLSYGLINPIAKLLEKHHKASLDYIKCLQISISSYIKGYAPLIIVEFTRKVIPKNVRPSFAELEELINKNGT